MAFNVLEEKLSPAKKAWKRLISTLQSKLNQLETSKAMNKTANCFFPLPLRKRKHHPYYCHHECYVNHRRSQRGTATEWMEKPFEEVKSVDEMKEERNGEGTHMSLQLLGVDAKAQDFIDKMKQELKLQRQESEENFKAMLERGM